MKNITKNVITGIGAILLTMSFQAASQENNIRYNKPFPLEVVPNSTVGTPFRLIASDGTFPGNPKDYPADCAELLEYGYSTGDGTYTIYVNNSPEVTEQVQCDMTSNGGGYNIEPFTLAMLDQPNEIIYSYDINTGNPWQNDIVNNSNTPLTEEDRGLYRMLIDVNRTDLVGHTFGVYSALPRVDGSLITREYILPNIDISPLSEVPVMVYVGVSSWTGDTDSSRIYWQPRIYEDYTNNPSNFTSINEQVADSGLQNWGGVRSYRYYNRVMPAEVTHTRFWAQCKRYYGTECSADAYDYNTRYFPRLPAIGDTVRVKDIN